MEKIGYPFGEADLAMAIIERVVDGLRRVLRRASRQEHEDAVVTRQLERRKTRPVALTELRPRREKERHIGAELRRELAQRLGRQRRREGRIRQPQGDRSIGAPTSETRGDRNALLERHPPARSDAGAIGQGLERMGYERIRGEAFNDESVGGLEASVSARSIRS